MTPYSRLPRLTYKFLRTPEAEDADVAVHRFHGWLSKKGLTLEILTPRHVRSFLTSSLRVAEARMTGYDFKAQLVVYLDFLYRKHRLPFDPDLLRAPCSRRLPVTVERYVTEMGLTLKSSTVGCRRTTLRKFHRWLHERNLTLRGFAREHATEWLFSLATKRLHPSTRRDQLATVRAYLRWLAEAGLVFRDPDDLLRSSDQPKLPQYLPRPFPQEIDREIMRRLAAAPDRESQAMLLMRRTGLRIGELMTLPLGCVSKESDGHHYLKVPLGKMNNERIVPLDDDTARLAEALTQRGEVGRTWLLEEHQGRRPTATKYIAALSRAADGLALTERATSHRLRHTYATSLLNAGMSLIGVMALLGHKDYRMTLRYAAILPETVGDEYFKALGQIEEKYRVAVLRPGGAIGTSEQMLADVIKWLRSRAPESSNPTRLAALTRRLDAIKDEVHAIESRPRQSISATPPTEK